MFGGLSLLGSTKKDAKPAENILGLDVTKLQDYVNGKIVKTKDAKNKNREKIYNYCASALEVGKCQIGIYLLEQIEKSVQDKDKKAQYESLLEDLYIAYKINEFLELYHSYSFTSEPIESIFTDRSGMTLINKKTEDLDLWELAKGEVERLYYLFRNMHYQSDMLTKQINLPKKLPDKVKTGSWLSGWVPGPSRFHFAIKDLYEQCYKKLAEMAKLEKLEKTEPKMN